MKSGDLEILKSGDLNKIKIILDDFNKKYENLFEFTEFNVDDKWKKIWISLFTLLREPKNSAIYLEVLTSIRILTRDKNNLNSITLQKDLEILLNIADLGPNNVTNMRKSYSDETIIASLKCICNLVFQNTECQKLCLKNSATDGILRRVRSPTAHHHEIEFFDMKLLFLITALEQQTRQKVKDDLNGLTYLTEWLDVKVKETKSDKQSELINEILKVLFNITANNNSTDENVTLHNRLIIVLRNILFSYADMDSEKNILVVSNTVNLLTNMPTSSLSELLIREEKCNQNEKAYEGQCVKSLEVLIEHLKICLKSADKEKLAPMLSVLVKCVRCNSTMRHYIRSVILPPLTHVNERPEVGNDLRNHLCRFLTSVDTIIRDLSAELLFVCCKENVARMVKHTGYGNAAGLLASKGVLDGRKKENTEYSSDSEDSDTEEYKRVAHNINPILGCYESPRKNPMEGMTEEQKEYEAMKLANLMDQLYRQGIVQPCRINEDGKPEPLEHILQLQEELPKQQNQNKNKS
ncbi:synembryn [Condylostylus longicornis]|uniref:synembryn n=1 Tax=Condylostylus longicornis TaxID=2530218 RepID=UPI00244DF8EC|nr:synembryn [Condylostylus longicornis]